MSTVDNSTDLQLISQALTMWVNHIQTGSVTMSVQDAINCGNQNMIKPLDPNQIAFVDRLNKLSTKALEQDSRKKQM